MTTLPEVPAEARTAAVYAYTFAEFKAGLEYRDDTADLPNAAVDAAWPHLYAAALRHVVADLEARNCSFAGLTYLREMADEAIR